MASLEVEKLSMMIDLADLVRVRIGVVVNVFLDGLIWPGTFPQSGLGVSRLKSLRITRRKLNLLVHHVHVLISYSIPLVMFNRGVQPNSFKGALFPRRDDVPGDSPFGQMVKC